MSPSTTGGEVDAEEGETPSEGDDGVRDLPQDEGGEEDGSEGLPQEADGDYWRLHVPQRPVGDGVAEDQGDDGERQEEEELPRGVGCEGDAC